MSDVQRCSGKVLHRYVKLNILNLQKFATTCSKQRPARYRALLRALVSHACLVGDRNDIICSIKSAIKSGGAGHKTTGCYGMDGFPPELWLDWQDFAAKIVAGVVRIVPGKGLECPSMVCDAWEDDLLEPMIPAVVLDSGGPPLVDLLRPCLDGVCTIRIIDPYFASDTKQTREGRMALYDLICQSRCEEVHIICVASSQIGSLPDTCKDVAQQIDASLNSCKRAELRGKVYVHQHGEGAPLPIHDRFIGFQPAGGSGYCLSLCIGPGIGALSGNFSKPTFVGMTSSDGFDQIWNKLARFSTPFELPYRTGPFA